MENEYKALTPGDGVGGTLAARESLEDSVREHAFPLPSPPGGTDVIGVHREKESQQMLSQHPVGCSF